MSGIFGSRPAGSSLFGQPIAGPNPTASTFNMGQGFNPQASAQLAQSQAQQASQIPAMPALSQSQAQLSNSLWQPGKENPRTCLPASQHLYTLFSNRRLTLLPDQKPIPEQILMIAEKWDPSDPHSVFKYYFYNKVEEANVPFYKPQPHENPKEWEEALQRKPAPGFMPVLCSGFAQLADRLKTQKRAVTDFNIRLHQVNKSLDAIMSRHDLETSVRALAARRRHAVLSERCLALAAKVQVLRNRGYALSGDEDDLRIKLQGLERSMQDPALSAKEEELWSRLIVLRGYAEQLTREANKPLVVGDDGLPSDLEEKAKKVGPPKTLRRLG